MVGVGARVVPRMPFAPQAAAAAFALHLGALGAGRLDLLPGGNRLGARDEDGARGKASHSFGDRPVHEPTNPQVARRPHHDEIGPDVERELNEHGSCETSYVAETLGSYRVAFRAVQAGGFAASIVKAEPPEKSAMTPTASAASVEPVSAAEVHRDEVRAARASQKLIEWLHHAAAARASDLHLAEGDPPCMRVDGRSSKSRTRSCRI